MLKDNEKHNKVEKKYEHLHLKQKSNKVKSTQLVQNSKSEKYYIYYLGISKLRDIFRSTQKNISIQNKIKRSIINQSIRRNNKAKSINWSPTPNLSLSPVNKYPAIILNPNRHLTLVSILLFKFKVITITLEKYHLLKASHAIIHKIRKQWSVLGVWTRWKKWFCSFHKKIQILLKG